MNESITLLHIRPMDMLSMSIIVLFIGMYLNRRIDLLSRNYIPPAVTGGLLFSVFTWLLHSGVGIDFEFDMRFRDLLLLVFFSTVGLSVRVSELGKGGRALLIMTALTAFFLIAQNAIGVGVALLFGKEPGYGIMAGSVSLAGGHGTAAAWGAQAENLGLANASTIGLIFATCGLVAGGLLGGPLARYLIERNGLEPATGNAEALDEGKPTGVPQTAQADYLFKTLQTLLVLALCVSLGDLVNRFLGLRGMLLPGFLTAMAVAIILANSMHLVGRPVYAQTVKLFGEVSLNIFLVMSMMSMQFWLISGALSAVTLVLLLQMLLMTLFATLVVFRVMGKDYDAAVIAAGFTGLGLGATPVAIANMDAVALRYGWSPTAFLVVPLIGAFFLDILNAGVIQFFFAIVN